jgi:carboxyl-terminal processing protease
MTIRRFLAPVFAGVLLCLGTVAALAAASASGEDNGTRELPAGGAGPGIAKPAEFRETPVMAEETKLLVQWLEDIHYLNTPISEDLFKKVIPQFMGYLDDQRMFFTASDETELRARFGASLNDQLRNKGSLQAAYTIFKVYRERAEERVAWVLAELEREMDFTADETFSLSRQEEPWPATRADADDLWRRRLKFELIPDLLNDKTIAEAKDTVRKRYERMLKNVREIEAVEIQEAFLTTLTQLYDPHSTFLSSETYEDFSIQMRLSLIGIGAVLSSEEGYCVVKELMPGGPASLSKQIQVNDKIVAVAQGEQEAEDVIGMPLRKVVNKIRGKKGTSLTLTIVPADATDTSIRKTVTLAREVVQLNASRAHATIQEVPAPDGSMVPIGVIEVPSFYGTVDESDRDTPAISVTADVEELLGKLTAANVRGVILDLRRNPGGLLGEAVQMTGLFISKGPVVQVRNAFGRITSTPDYDPRIVYGGPLMVLTSRYSASASEIVAGALQNYGRAIILGDKSTHGKGTVQAVLEVGMYLPGRLAMNAKAGAAKLTTQKYYLPNGSSTQNKGVVPDISLPAIEDFLPIGESDLPNSLPWDTIDAARFNGRQLDVGLRNILSAETQQRVTSLEEFQFLQRRIDWLREREAMKAISINLEKRREMKQKDEAFRDEMKAEQTRLAALNYAKQDVLLNSVAAATEPAAPTVDEISSPETEGTDRDAPPFDVHLREALRVICDAIRITPDPVEWTENTRTLAIISARQRNEANAARN